MNVGELKQAVLRNMNEDDLGSIPVELGDEILSYLNDGYLNAVLTGEKPVKRKECQAVNGRISVSELDEDFYDVSRISNRLGQDVGFYCNGEYIFTESGIFEVEYLFVPPLLTDDSDVPIIDEAYHHILSDYATYRMMLKGSRGRQERGNAFLSEYLAGLRKLGRIRYRTIRNKFGGFLYG